MHWFFIALVGPIVWSIVNHTDKYLLSKYSKEKEGGVGSLMIFSTLFSVFLLPILFFLDQSVFSVSISNILLLLLVGFINGLSIFMYMSALETDEASIVVPFFQIVPVFGYFLGYLMLGEVLNINKIAPACLLIFGAIILSLEFSEDHPVKIKKKVFSLMLGSTFMIAFSEVLFKFVAIEEEGFWLSSFWNYAGLVLFGLILYICVKSYRTEFITLIKTSGKIILSLNIASEGLTLMGNIAFMYATLLAPIALVMTVTAYQPAIVFLIGIILTLYVPK